MNDKGHENTATAPPVTIGEHWLRRARQIAQRRLPGDPRLRFIATVVRRRQPSTSRFALTEQVQARQLAVAPRPLTTALSRMTPTPDGWPAAQPPVPAPAATGEPVAGGAITPVPQDGRPALFSPPHAGQPALRPLPIGRVVRPDQTDSQRAPTSEPTVGAEGLPATVAHSPPLRLDARTLKVLGGVLDRRIPVVKIYANPAADEVARQHRADAVTYGENILFRTGKFDPSTPEGLGLLGHELTHVVQAGQDAGGPMAPLAPYQVAQEEAIALHHERQVLNRLANAGMTPAAPPVFSPPLAYPFGTVAPAPASHETTSAPHTAAMARTAQAGGRPSAPPAVELLTSAQLQQIKEAVYRDLMERMRTEFERGG